MSRFPSVFLLRPQIGRIVWCLLAVFSFADSDRSAGEEMQVPWSFQRLIRPAVPQAAHPAWPADDIDRFILARQEEAGVPPNPDADRRTLIRRASFDLTGLPPTVGEIQAFLRDSGSDAQAFARVIDAYLASPRFGERWARHWLDVARYADSVGRTWNAPLTYAWRYRDWVIDSFNRDKPYNRFIGEQIAGDLLPAPTVEQRRDQVTGTGFLALAPLVLNSGRFEAYQLDQIDDQIDVVTRGFLGLSVACARCHDHKYEPVTQRDYYSLAGIFLSSVTLPGQAHLGDGANYVDATRLVRLPSGDARDPVRRVVELPPGIHSMSDFQGLGGAKVPPPYTMVPDLAMAVIEGQPSDCAVRIAGDARDRGEVPPRGLLDIPGLPPLSGIPADQSGRLELARWIASPNHPLTPRVMANRVWQHLFGRGLVDTVDDFGFSGQAPSHPELLDHLAVRFVEGGWSVKSLIRSIMLSRTYRLSSQGTPLGLEKDPDNLLHWRMAPRRMEFEPIRDAMLQVAGVLRLERPEGIQVTGTGGTGRVGQTRSWLDLDDPYRTIYLPVLRDLLPDAYGTFDFPDPAQVNGRRHITTSAPQALHFMNSDFVVSMARQTAARLLEEEPRDEATRISLAYLWLFGREPYPDEVDSARELLRDSASSGSGEPEYQAWSVLVQGLLASAEFRYLL